MTQPLTVAYSELTRVLPWSLRALGYKFGTADRGAHLVAAAAAMGPAVLDAVAKAEPRSDRGSTLRRTPEGLVIDAPGISLLEIGPVAVDHLAAHAEGASFRTCLIAGATEMALLPAVVAGAGAYGLACLAIFSGTDTHGWHLSFPDGESTVLTSGEDIGTLAGLLGDRTDLAAMAGLASRAPGTVLLAAGHELTAKAPPGAVSPAQMIRQAQRRGIPVSQATLDALYGLEMLTWAPTSERSRSQAGFTMPPGAQQ